MRLLLIAFKLTSIIALNVFLASVATCFLIGEYSMNEYGRNTIVAPDWLLLPTEISAGVLIVSVLLWISFVANRILIRYALQGAPLVHEDEAPDWEERPPFMVPKGTRLELLDRPKGRDDTKALIDFTLEHDNFFQRSTAPVSPYVQQWIWARGISPKDRVSVVFAALEQHFNLDKTVPTDVPNQ